MDEPFLTAADAILTAKILEIISESTTHSNNADFETQIIRKINHNKKQIRPILRTAYYSGLLNRTTIQLKPHKKHLHSNPSTTHVSLDEARIAASKTRRTSYSLTPLGTKYLNSYKEFQQFTRSICIDMTLLNGTKTDNPHNFFHPFYT